jgi:hypothetical protein
MLTSKFLRLPLPQTGVTWITIPSKSFQSLPLWLLSASALLLWLDDESPSNLAREK